MLSVCIAELGCSGPLHHRGDRAEHDKCKEYKGKGGTDIIRSSSRSSQALPDSPRVLSTGQTAPSDVVCTRFSNVTVAIHSVYAEGVHLRTFTNIQTSTFFTIVLSIYGPHHFLALWNIWNQGPTVPHSSFNSRGYQLFASSIVTRSGCGIMATTRPSGV